MGDELDPAFRGPPATRCEGGHCGEYINQRPELLGSQAAQLAALANRRVRPPTGPGAIGRSLYELQQRALRNIETVRATAARMAERVAPWVQRLRDGKGGKLYRLREVLENTLRNNKAVRDALIKEKAERSKREAADRALSRSKAQRVANATRAALGRISSTGGDALATDALLIAEWALDIDAKSERLGKLHDEQQRRAARSIPELRSLGTIAGGAVGTVPRRESTGKSSSKPVTVASSKPVSTSKLLTGTGSKSVAAATKLRSGGASVVASQVKKLGESTKSLLARSIMATSPQLPTVLRTPVKSLSGVRLSTSAQLLSPQAFPRVSVRTPVRVPARGGARVTPATLPQLTTFGMGLTPLNMTGVGSRLAEPKCDCRKPKKETKERKERCSNPLISRKVEGNVVTIKRELKCQPSR